MSTFLVIGIYDDNGQRFAQDVEADTAGEAEVIIHKGEESPISIAAVMLVHDDDLDRLERGDMARMKLVQ